MTHSLADGASNEDDVGDAKNESTSSPVRHDACHETADKRAQRCRRGNEFLEAARKNVNQGFSRKTRQDS